MYDDILNAWLVETAGRTSISRSTRATYLRVGRRLVRWRAAPGGPPVLAEYVAARRQEGAGPRTIALELRVLSVATHWAHRELRAPSPPALPCVRVDPKVFVLNHRTPTPSEAAAALRSMPPDEWRLAARLIAATGARVGEIVALRGADLDLTDGRIALGATDGASKTGMRWFPLDAATLRALAGRQRTAQEHLLDFGGVTAPIQALERRVLRACDAAGVARFTPHGLRRMVIGRLIRAQVDPATAASLTGHSIDVMLKHYHSVTEDDRRAAAERAMLGVLDELPRDR